VVFELVHQKKFHFASSLLIFSELPLFSLGKTGKAGSKIRGDIISSVIKSQEPSAIATDWQLKIMAAQHLPIVNVSFKPDWCQKGVDAADVCRINGRSQNGLLFEKTDWQ
jgi:hypothetical protein